MAILRFFHDEYKSHYLSKKKINIQHKNRTTELKKYFFFLSACLTCLCLCQIHVHVGYMSNTSMLAILLCCASQHEHYLLNTGRSSLWVKALVYDLSLRGSKSSNKGRCGLRIVGGGLYKIFVGEYHLNDYAGELRI